MSLKNNNIINITTRARFLVLSVLLLSVSSFTANASGLTPVKFCVWDPVGASGPFISFLKDTKLKAISWGVDLQMDAYTDEKVAANDFRSELCAAVLLTNILAKDFVPFSAAFGAPGAIRTLDELKVLSKTLTSPKAEKLISNGKYQVSALFPIGEIYTFVRDKSNVDISAISGKKVSILNADVASERFAKVVGASPVHTSLATWGGQFNNGNVDVMFAPALAYNTFELYKGLGDTGGIVDFNILYAVMEMVVNTDKIPAGFADNMRKHALSRFDELENTVKQAHSEIPQKYWVSLDAEKKAEYESLSKDIRLALRDEKAYDSKAISILWKIRCKFNPSATECASPE
jgi:Solute-binding protein AdeT 1/2